MSVTEQKDEPTRMVAGFWIRVAADAIDMSLLYGFALILGLVLEGWFLKLGENGVWFGLLISIAYFVPMQSSFGNGQSLGKRLLGIQVLSLDGHPLSLAKSFLRYLVIAFVGYSGVFMGIATLAAGSAWTAFMDSIMGTLWFGVFIGCYLLIPFHPLKRGLHDLVAGSIVVYRDQFNATALTKLDDPAKTKKVYTTLACLTAITIAVGVWGFKSIFNNVSLENMRELQSKLEATGKFSSTSVMDNTFSNNSGSTRSIIVQTHVDGPFDQNEQDLKLLYDLAFQKIRDQVPDISKYSYLRVGLRMGYNLGIRKKYHTVFQDENPNKPGDRKESGSSTNF